MRPVLSIALLTLFALIVLPILFAVVVIYFGRLALWAGAVSLAILIWSAIHPISLPVLKGREGSILLSLGMVVGLTVGVVIVQQSEELEALKSSEPDRYLVRLKELRSDAEWLGALKEMKPEAYIAEFARREVTEKKEKERREKLAQIEKEKRDKAEAERKAREAKEQVEKVAKEAAEAEEALRLQVKDYVIRLQNELKKISSFKTKDHVESETDILNAVRGFSNWAEIADEGHDLPLEKGHQSIRAEFRQKLSRTQKKSYPILRNAYGPLVSKRLWIKDMSARTSGSGYQTIEYVGVMFAANRNVKSFHEDKLDVIEQLRFKKVRYRWFSMDPNPKAFRLNTPDDGKIAIWN